MHAEILLRGGVVRTCYRPSSGGIAVRSIAAASRRLECRGDRIALASVYVAAGPELAAGQFALIRNAHGRAVIRVCCRSTQDGDVPRWGVTGESSREEPTRALDAAGCGESRVSGQRRLGASRGGPRIGRNYTVGLREPRNLSTSTAYVTPTPWGSTKPGILRSPHTPYGDTGAARGLRRSVKCANGHRSRGQMPAAAGASRPRW